MAIAVDNSMSQGIAKPDSQNSTDYSIPKIIIDEPAKEDALDFQHYSHNLADIIRETTPKFAVGIFGKWELARLL